MQLELSRHRDLRTLHQYEVNKCCCCVCMYTLVYECVHVVVGTVHVETVVQDPLELELTGSRQLPHWCRSSWCSCLFAEPLLSPIMLVLSFWEIQQCFTYICAWI